MAPSLDQGYFILSVVNIELSTFGRKYFCCDQFVFSSQWRNLSSSATSAAARGPKCGPGGQADG